MALSIWQKDKRELAEKRAAFWEYVELLGSIVESRSYQEEYDTVEDFLKNEASFSRQYYYDLIEQCQTRKRLSDVSDKIPDKVTHLKEISKVPEDKQIEVFATTLERCEQEKRQPTAKDFKKTAKEIIAESKPAAKKTEESKPKPPETTGNQRKEPETVYVCCKFCNGTGQIREVKATPSDFDEFWQVVLDHAPKGSRMKEEKPKAKKAYQVAIEKINKKGIEVDGKREPVADPIGYLKTRLFEYVISDRGQGKYAKMVYGLLQGEFWNVPTENWEESNGKPSLNDLNGSLI